MAGHRPFRELVTKTMSPEAQRRARLLASRDLARLELAELREALKLTQAKLAKKLKISQVAVSRLERRPDMHVSSLRQLIEAMGGRLEITAIFDGQTVRLSHLGKSDKNLERKAS